MYNGAFVAVFPSVAVGTRSGEGNSAACANAGVAANLDGGSRSNGYGVGSGGRAAVETAGYNVGSFNFWCYRNLSIVAAVFPFVRISASGCQRDAFTFANGGVAANLDVRMVFYINGMTGGGGATVGSTCDRLGCLTFG